MMIEPVSIPEGKRGPWAVERFTVSPEDSSFTAMRAAVKGRGYLPPGQYTKLVHERRGIVMSDTPDERIDHQAPVRLAEGHVLLNGLGLGMVLAACLKKPSVTKVTVVEKDADVIALVGPHYSTDPRVEIIHADAFEYKPPKGARFGVVWHDIWDAICGDNLEQMTKLKRKYARRAVWQGCWAERECRCYG